MANERLRSVLVAHGLTPAELAAKVDVDPKTVERWVNTERVPHARHRMAVAQLLGVEVSFLWADAISALASVQVSRAELVTLYPSRADAPPELWRDLFAGAREAIGVIAYAAIFLFEQNPDLPRLLADKADNGCRVRLALGDVNSEEVRQRGEEEHFGLGIDSRVRLALKHLEPILDHPVIEIRQHRTTLYNSLFRFDDQMLVNTHLWGMSAFQAPLLHLRKVDGGKLFDTYATNLDAIWDEATPLSQAESS